MPTVQFGKRPGRTRGRPENKATADGQAKIAYNPLPAVDGVDVVAEVQTVTTDGTGGTFTLTLGANESGNIAYNATIGAMETWSRLPAS
jgi:Na+-translocating ferredoxin:NAD+ oxidoreductase RnfG subunit